MGSTKSLRRSDGCERKSDSHLNLVRVGSILRVRKGKFCEWILSKKLKFPTILCPARSKLSTYRNSNFLEELHQFIISCGDKAELFGRSLLAENDPLPLSPLSVRNLPITSRTPPFDLIGLRYLSQSSHVKT